MNSAALFSRLLRVAAGIPSCLLFLAGLTILLFEPSPPKYEVFLIAFLLSWILLIPLSVASTRWAATFGWLLLLGQIAVCALYKYPDALVGVFGNSANYFALMVALLLQAARSSMRRARRECWTLEAGSFWKRLDW